MSHWDEGEGVVGLILHLWTAGLWKCKDWLSCDEMVRVCNGQKNYVGYDKMDRLKGKRRTRFEHKQEIGNISKRISRRSN